VFMDQLIFDWKPDILHYTPLLFLKLFVTRFYSDCQGIQGTVCGPSSTGHKESRLPYKKPNSQLVHISMDFYPLNNFEVFDLGHRVTVDSSVRLVSSNDLEQS